MQLVMYKGAGQRLFLCIDNSYCCMTFASFFFLECINSILYEFYSNDIFFISQPILGKIKLFASDWCITFGTKAYHFGSLDSRYKYIGYPV